MTTPTGAYAVDDLLLDAAESLFAGTCSFDAVQAAESQGWAPEIWQAVAEAGFAWIGIDEAAGGSGGSLADICEVVRIAGAHAAPIPLAETAMLGGWLLAQAGLPLPDGAIGVVPGFEGDTLTATATDAGVVLDGTAHRVRWSQQVEQIALLTDVDGRSAVVAINPGDTKIDHLANMAGEPRDTIRCDGVEVPTDRVGFVDDALIGEQLRLRGALSRTMLIAGALEAMSQLTIDYTNERTQFGRPIGRFQAVQQHLVWGAQDAAISKITAQRAAAHAGACDDVTDARFEIAAARTLANECAATAARGAHQAHGAMGMTQEYALHHLSRRLWAWRHEWSAPNEWPSTVGHIVEAAGPDGLYPLITS